MSCVICGNPTQGVRKTCSQACRNKVSSQTMSRTNLKYCSERMKTNNPMMKETSREKMRATHKRIGHQPKVKGGNGREPTKPEMTLKFLFGMKLNHTVTTGVRKGSIYPYHYKLDLALPELKLALEADGSSHSTLKRKEQDRRKDEFLNGLGWTVLRFTNQQIMNDLHTVFQTVSSTISRLKQITPT